MTLSRVNGVEVLIPPPNGYHVDFANPEKDTVIVTASICVFGILSFIGFLFVSQFLYVVFLIRPQWRVAAWIMFPAWLLLTVSQSLLLICFLLSILGVHTWELSLDDAIKGTTLIYVAILVAIPGTLLAKLVSCIIYYDISPEPSSHRIAYCAAGSSIVLFAVALIFTQLACKPVQAIDKDFDRRPPFYMVQAAMACLTDLIMIAASLPLIVPRNMTWENKVNAILRWNLGNIIQFAAAMTQLVALIPSIRNPDITFVLARFSLCSIVATNLNIICNSFFTLRSFFGHTRKIFRQRQRSADLENAISSVHTLEAIRDTIKNPTTAVSGGSFICDSQEQLVSPRVSKKRISVDLKLAVLYPPSSKAASLETS